MKLKSLKTAYLNISGNFYPNDYINLARVEDNKIAFNDSTLFLNKELKEVLNQDKIKRFEDVVVIFKLENSWGVICNILIKDYKEKKILCHELVLSDVIQRMLSNFHNYNSEANPVILLHNKKLNLEEFVDKNKEEYKIEKEELKLYVYSQEKAKDIILKLEENEHFYIADGHHRLYSTSLYFEKETVMSCIYEMEEINIEAIPRKIENITQEKYLEIIEKIKNKFIMLDNTKKLEKGEVRLYYKKNILTFKLLEISGDLFSNNDIYRLNTQVISDIFRIFKDDGVKFLSIKELKKELLNQETNDIYLETAAMDKFEFMKTIENGNIMPPKSTYFKPKFPSFLVFNTFK
ncbi:DUF1015 family protein [Fusobacterium sp. SYSU M8D902]|uniref:DUF1015 family protein n=1 Tax=Fusobacterium sp. SYSU M8D902 TaxID=3159562 RepID=UPI0032E4D342